MSVIKFSPTTIYVWDGYEFNHEGEPLMTGSSPNSSYFTAMWFDIDEVVKVINASNQAVDANFYMYITEPGRLTLSMHKEGLPDEQNRPTYYVAGIGWIDTNTGDLTINVNNLGDSVAIEVLGHYGRVTLIEALNAGFKGFVAYSGTDYPVLEAINLELQIEGEWDNQTPTIRTPVGGELQNVAEPTRFTWVHNAPFDQESFELRYRIRGTSTWTTVTEETSEQEYTLPPNTLETGEYEWQVRTISEYGFESPWSSIGVFNAAETTPTPTIIEPAEGSTIEISDLYIEWEADEQDEYEVEVLDGSGNVVWSGSGGTDTSIEVEGILENGETYTVRVRVNVDGGIFSSWAESTFEVDYTEPANPTLTFVTDDDKSTITVYIENPTPTGTEPNVTTQDLYRRRKGESDWIKLVEHLQANDFFVDYTPAHETEYEYYVRVRGDNDTNTNSDIFTSSVKVKHVLLSLVNNLPEQVRLKMSPSNTFDTNFSATTKRFSGRRNPVVEFGETIETTGSISYLVFKDTLDKLSEFLHRQETLLYRDSRGRKKFVTVSNISVNDHQLIGMYSIDLSMTEVDYHEGLL